MASPFLTSLLALILSFSLLSLSKSSSPAPLTPRSFLLRYWARKITNGKPQPPFFVSKLSPLSPVAYAAFSSLSPSDLSSTLHSFCSSAHLACDPLRRSPSSLEAHSGPSAFTAYTNSSFNNYATKSASASTSFSNYSALEGGPTVDTFRRYSRDATNFTDAFSGYSGHDTFPITNFTSYSSSSRTGSGHFSSYHSNSTLIDMAFTSYDASAVGPTARVFQNYGEVATLGDENFASYSKKGEGIGTAFAGYSEGSAGINSGFKGYGEKGKGANDSFTSYSEKGNSIPSLRFSNYDADGNNADRDFAAYNTGARIGDQNFTSYGNNGVDSSTAFAAYGAGAIFDHESFTSYGKSGNGLSATFTSYAANLSAGVSSSFSGYGEGGKRAANNFTSYGEGSFTEEFNFTSYLGDSFKGYESKKEGNKFTFTSYSNASAAPRSDSAGVGRPRTEMTMGGGVSASRWVEPGRFFREGELRKGTVMPMPDIRDKMPPRSFLPRSISAKIPFSAGEVRRTFKLPEDTAMGKAVGDTVAECERAPSRGETKRCAASAEDMIDFAVSVLGSNVVVRSTENTRGSKGSVMIGEVRGVNGGKVTRSVSCHQSLFPYLVYYCHSVPKVRVYEADILAADGGEKINHGVAICHVDTSDWSAGHGAFVALGSGPGKIEVCHWIFEGDMTWAVAD